MISTIGKAYDHRGGVAVKTTRPPENDLSDTVTVLWHDRRSISPEQRRKAWALVGEIAAANGYLSAADKSQINGDMKRKFLIERIDELTAEAIKRFSLSNVDMTTARLYITFLIDFVVEHDIPTHEPAAQLCEDVEAYVYACLMHKRCAVCRRPADLHHVDRVGMGRNREEISHIGMRCLPLCRAHHQEAHRHGDGYMFDRYHLEPIAIDEKIASVYKLKGENRNEQADHHREPDARS